MLRKLALDQTKLYEQHIATYEIANMLVDFIKGKKHYLSIGCEQGNIDTWDDIVIGKENSYFVHVQVKRQIATDFGDANDTCLRNTYIQGKRNGQLRDLSPIDKSIKAIADWLKIPTNNPSEKEFWFELPEKNTEIKPGLKILHLYELCQIHYQHNVTRVSDLGQLSLIDPNVKKCYDWLTTWCDFQDWTHIIKVLPLLKIKDSGLEAEIRQKTEEKLNEVFLSDKVTEIHDKILSFTHLNTTFAGAISPRSILEQLKMYLLPTIHTWTQFEKNGSGWNIFGINDIDSINHIERPEKVVTELWNNNRPKVLKVNTTPNDNCKMSDSLLRLAIHQEGNLHSNFNECNNWKNLIKNKTGGTIGISENDIESTSISENNEQFTSSEFNNINLIAQIEGFSELLENSMYNETWERVKNKIKCKINSMQTDNSSELRGAVEERWNIWETDLNTNPKEYKILFKNMLHPKAEGNSIRPEIRIGCKTVDNLSEGLFLLLIISVCLDPTSQGNWFNIPFGAINTISMEYWSGESGKQRNVRRIVYDSNIIIGKEESDILLLPRINASPNDLLENTIADSTNSDKNTLANGRQLKLLVTGNIKLNNLIEQGNINELSNYLKQLSKPKAKEQRITYWQKLVAIFI